MVQASTDFREIFCGIHEELCLSYFELILVIDAWGISCEIALRWMLLDLSDDKREREIKFIGLFEDRGHRGPYSLSDDKSKWIQARARWCQTKKITWANADPVYVD